MMFTAILVAAFVGSGGVLGKEGSSCKLTLQTDLDASKEPLILAVQQTEIREKDDDGNVDLHDKEIETLSIARPEVVNGKGVVTIAPDKELLLACLGDNNANKGSKKETAYLSCSEGQLMLDNEKATQNTLSCSRSYSESSVMVTKESCGSGDNIGTLIQLGFLLSDKSWFPLVDVCHNIERSVTLYSSHAVYGHSLKGGIKCNERKRFTRGPKPLFSDVNPDSVYTKRSQVKSFDKILGNGGADLYLNNTSFLARGHLAPDADFIFNSGQMLTYYYVNAAPQWQSFNAGNWLIIENAVRDLAVKEDETLYVHTGTFGVLKLPNADDKERMIYLEPSQKLIPAPQVYWKLVQHPVTKSCTVVVGHNNVFLKKEPTPICTPVKPSGWPTLENLAKGYTYYCNYESFKETVTFAPTVTCKDLFDFPDKTN